MHCGKGWLKYDDWSVVFSVDCIDVLREILCRATISAQMPNIIGLTK